jgi:hypothetical protein
MSPLLLMMEQVEGRLRDLEELLKDQEASADKLKSTTEALQTELMEVGKAIYSSGGGEGGGGAGPPPGTDTPIDAEFKDAEKPS